jgi:hypothetical protein
VWGGGTRRPRENEEVGSDADGADGEVGAETPAEGERPSGRGGFDRWRRESALGAVGTGVARGLQAVFAPPVDEVVIVAAVPGDPPDADERVRVILDPDDPAKSVAIVPPKSPDGRPG